MVGLSQGTVRSCLRDGLLDAQPDALPLRFTFQDLRVLKLIKTLTLRGVSIRRACRQLQTLRHRSSDGRSLASMSIDAHEGHVVIRGAKQAWRADSGQLVFGFQFREPLGDLAILPHRAPTEPPEFMACLTADEWFEEALACEEASPSRAIESYQQVLRQRPEHVEALINLGRLHAEEERMEEAVKCFEAALELNPCAATALYNLGVIAQDRGDDEDAILKYCSALSFDSELAEAHYNLATLYDKRGDAQAAIRHINEFRKCGKPAT